MSDGSTPAPAEPPADASGDALGGGRTKQVEACCFVIFGASGDLTKRLLVPALYNLAALDLLPAECAIIGTGRSPLSDGALRDQLMDGLRQFATRKVDGAVAERLFSSVTYVQGDPDEEETYTRLDAALKQVEGARDTKGNRLFYLATPPSAFAPVARHLSEAGLSREEGHGWRRLIVEKPFGTDLASAKKLNSELLEVLDESQIYRMDHYLGKETVQNIMILRFANGLFEPIWNRNHIDHVQITVAEMVGVESRGQYFDHTGTLRDMVPNHLFQLMSLITMEPPSRFEANSVRSEKAEALDAIGRLSDEQVFRDTVRGQYEAGTVNGKQVGAYRRTDRVNPESTTETYAALRLTVDNWRWAGVPFYLRTGKALKRRKTEIAIKFKEAPIAMFRDADVGTSGMTQNYLVLGIQPDEGIQLQFNAKRPGARIDLARVGMTFNYRDYFEAAPSTGYETLIYDCMIGDAMLFQRADGVEAGWRVVQPLLDAWADNGREMATYAAGSDGPKAADELIERDGRRWRPLE